MSRLATRMATLAAVALAAAFAARPAFAATPMAETFLGLPTWLWMTLNLILFFGLLGYFLVPPISRYLATREQRIHEELEDARERRAQVAGLEATLGAKVTELEAEMEHLRQRAEVEGEREREELLAQAAREKKRLLEQAEGEIDHRLAQARQELKDYTAALAADLARGEIDRRLDDGERHRLFERNLVRLERDVREAP